MLAKAERAGQNGWRWGDSGQIGARAQKRRCGGRRCNKARWRRSRLKTRRELEKEEVLFGGGNSEIPPTVFFVMRATGGRRRRARHFRDIPKRHFSALRESSAIYEGSVSDGKILTSAFVVYILARRDLLSRSRRARDRL